MELTRSDCYILSFLKKNNYTNIPRWNKGEKSKPEKKKSARDLLFI